MLQFIRKNSIIIFAPVLVILGVPAFVLLISTIGWTVEWLLEWVNTWPTPQQ